MTPAPIDLADRAIHFHPDGTVRDEDKRTPARPGSRQLATFHAESDQDVHADHWEQHPSAEEVVCCLTGAMRLMLRPEAPDAPEETVRLSPGTCFVVPRGRWHRIEVDEPTDLLSITPRHGTRLESRA
ncbi:MAG TPA: cupin domain-containing protein [Streptomyces sp.]|nr:cupin domain-containing protein [Streptomyces sp.]